MLVLHGTGNQCTGDLAAVAVEHQSGEEREVGPLWCAQWRKAACWSQTCARGDSTGLAAAVQQRRSAMCGITTPTGHQGLQAARELCEPGWCAVRVCMQPCQHQPGLWRWWTVRAAPAALRPSHVCVPVPHPEEGAPLSTACDRATEADRIYPLIGIAPCHIASLFDRARCNGDIQECT